ncbi:MAG: hypothetical protein Q4B58_03790 [Bacteroidales bacterium]|nr:hypothetical protein [Bacteroidales bacterium]
MALTFFNAKELEPNLKVTIQKSGKLGFTAQTAEILSITTSTYFRFAQDDDKTLFMVVSETPGDDAYRAYKAGDYFYLKTAPLFDHLGIVYSKDTVMFDLKRHSVLDEEAGGKVYLMKQRTAKTRKQEKSESATDLTIPGL